MSGNPFKEREERLAASEEETTEKVKQEVVKSEKPKGERKKTTVNNPRPLANKAKQKSEIDQVAHKTQEAKKVGRPTSAKGKTESVTIRLTSAEIEALESVSGRGRKYRDKSEVVREALQELLGIS